MDLYQFAQKEFVFCKRFPSHTYIVEGPDAERYLQGRVTQDVKSLGAARSLLLSPQGKIQAHFLLARQKPEFFLLISDPIQEEDLRSSLLQFKVADQLDFRAYEGARFSLRGKSTLEKLGIDYRGVFEGEIHGLALTLISAPVGSFSAYECLVSDPGKAQKVFTELGGKEVQEEVLEQLRIEAGLPEYGKDLNLKNTPGDFSTEGCVSFTKGCYSGQEVVEKQAALGKANKRLLVLDGIGPLPKAGEDILTSSGDKAGVVTSAAPGQQEKHFICMGLIKAKAFDEQALSCGEAKLTRR